MQTPVEIDFQGMDARPDVRNSIEKHVGRAGAALWPHHGLPGRVEGAERPSPHRRCL
jgi:hypothetical protein